MAITIKMPALSPTMTEGAIARWIKKEGDAVRSGDVLAEIETDKATMEVEAIDEGTLGKILVKEGTEGVAVNAAIAVLLEEGEDKAALAEAVKAAEAEAKQAPKAKETEEKPAPPKKEAAEALPAQAEPPPRPAAPAPGTPAASVAPAPAPAGKGGGRVFASPLARRLAEEAGIPLARIRGSGPRGRIVKADVEEAVAAGGVGVGGGLFAGMGQGFSAARPRLAPHSSMRKIIARRLVQSKQTVPHFYATVDCEIDRMLAVRKEVNETDETLRISVNDFVIRAVAVALGLVPEANVAWTDDGMHVFDQADVAVAVATEAGGLITPIVRAAERKGLAAISTEMKDLADRARAGKLTPEEYQGGTFTISNMGMFGVREFAAIINPPQGCILAVGAGEERVVVRDGDIAIATMMNCTVSCDHRAVDGAVGARFLAAFKELIEQPVRLIL